MKNLGIFTVIFVLLISILVLFSVIKNFTSLPGTTIKANAVSATIVDEKNTRPKNPRLKKIGNIPESKEYVKLFFIDKELGWLAEDKRIWKTENRGKTWALIYSLNEKSLDEIFDIFFTSPQNGWLI